MNMMTLSGFIVLHNCSAFKKTNKKKVFQLFENQVLFGVMEGWVRVMKNPSTLQVGVLSGGFLIFRTFCLDIMIFIFNLF